MGVDRLSNEMIKNTLIHFIEIILQVFNKCLKTGDIPKIWCYGLITSIYKKGNKLNDEELPYNIDLNKKITLDEVEKILKKLKKKKLWV